jgi:hypothetical protein
MCTPHFVDEVMKKKIAAYSATFRDVTKSPFGSEDQIGMLNLINAESRQAIVSCADAGKVFDLSVDHFIGMPGWIAANDPGFQIWMTHTPRGEELADAMKVGFEHNHLVLLRRLDFYVYPLRDSCRCIKSFRLPRQDIQWVRRE